MPSKKNTKPKKLTTVERRIMKQKTIMLEILEKVPVIMVASKKAGINKSTYYRWCKEDPEFASLAYEAKEEGTRTINELAQSKLIEHINEGNMTSIIYWLKNKDIGFMERKRIFNEVKRVDDTPLDPKAKEAIDNVFAMFERVARRAEAEFTDDGEDDAIVYDDDEFKPSTE